MTLLAMDEEVADGYEVVEIESRAEFAPHAGR
ncbi:hypothetical protein BH11ACT3_BH11ACT3_15610 [soil metagenome]